MPDEFCGVTLLSFLLQEDFQSVRLVSHQLRAGSRVVLVLSIIKEPSREIKYGSAKDVSEETIQDARLPLKIKWYNDTYVELP